MNGEVAGRTLADYLDEHGTLPLGEGLALFDALLQAVGEMHREGVTDGALNPERIVIIAPGRIALVPAGDAAPCADADAYRSPQQLDGKPADVRADVYALGVLAYRMLMGVLPYSAGDDPLDPHAYLPNLTDRVRRTLTIAVQKNLTERFGDALTFRAALRGESDMALASPTLRWAVPEGVPEGDTGAADEFAAEEGDGE
jgi:serine/threonine protein kinase